MVRLAVHYPAPNPSASSWPIQIIDHQTDKKYRGNQGKNSGNAIMQERPDGSPLHRRSHPE